MTAPALAPAPSGTAPTGSRTAVGADDTCERREDGVRCPKAAVRRVADEDLCREHAEQAERHLALVASIRGRR